MIYSHKGNESVMHDSKSSLLQSGESGVGVYGHDLIDHVIGQSIWV